MTVANVWGYCPCGNAGYLVRVVWSVVGVCFACADRGAVPAPKEERPWPGFCQTCKAPLDPPDLTWCPTCGCSDEDE